MKAVDLGYTPKYMLQDSPMSSSGGKKGKKKEKPPIVYPSLVICDKPELVEKLKLGEEVTATVKLKLTELRQRDPKSSDSYSEDSKIEFDVTSIQIESENSDDDKESSGDTPPDYSMLDKKDDDKDED